MARKPNVASKKQPRQSRSIATVAAIVEAATYILSRGGLADFTSNKVAERAGVNVASFYQYFPNKEALLFHIVQRTWDEQLARLEPILTSGDASPAERPAGVRAGVDAGRSSRGGAATRNARRLRRIA